jgi:hypothetical protein
MELIINPHHNNKLLTGLHDNWHQKIADMSELNDELQGDVYLLELFLQSEGYYFWSYCKMGERNSSTISYRKKNKDGISLMFEIWFDSCGYDIFYVTQLSTFHHPLPNYKFWGPVSHFQTEVMLKEHMTFFYDIEKNLIRAVKSQKTLSLMTEKE